MAEPATPTVTVDDRVAVGLAAVGILAATAAGYYTGTTGNWVPLLAASIALSLVVLFVSSEL